MDPLALAGVTFLLGVLSAGAGALFLAHFTEGREHAALRRALRAEIDENLKALKDRRVAPLSRSAWEAARVLDLTDTAFDALAAAYLEAARFNAANAALAERFARSESGAISMLGGGPPDPG